MLEITFRGGLDGFGEMEIALGSRIDGRFLGAQNSVLKLKINWCPYFQVLPKDSNHRNSPSSP